MNDEMEYVYRIYGIPTDAMYVETRDRHSYSEWYGSTIVVPSIRSMRTIEIAKPFVRFVDQHGIIISGFYKGQRIL